MHVRFKDPQKWTKHFDNPKRDAWQRPDEVVAQLGLEGNEIVADIGAGTGYFTVRLAQKLPQGKVLAVELEQPMVEWIRKRAAESGLTNVEAIVGEAADPKLPPGVDLVLLVNTYHHIEERSDYFMRLRDKLSDGGRLAIVDFRMGKLPVGPPDPHKMSQHQVERELKDAGYELCGRYDELPYQYVLFFCPAVNH